MRRIGASIEIAFSTFQPIDNAVGQKHRVRAKRKRRRAYLQRKKSALRATATRPAAAKQRAKQEPETAE
jgi:hypothetical protein